MSTKTIKAQAPAKINLYLRVLNKRDDGYHNIESVFQAISLYDELEFKLVDKGIQVTSSKPEISQENNLVYRTASLLQQKFSPATGVKIHLEKHIPIAAGLGGGSSDAAITLCTLNELWKLNLSNEELHQLASELGADVPFFIHGGTALAEGIGEKLTPWPTSSFWLILVKPDFPISTAWAYKMLKSSNKLGLTKTKNCIIILQLALLKNDLSTLSGILYNDFELLLVQEYPIIEQIKQKLVDSGAMGALMSGSGPTVFGIFAQHDTAKKALSKIKKFMGYRGEVFLAKAICGSKN